MTTNAERHSGLPFVPRPASDEVLGSWLLRVAQLYGLSLKTLLNRLGSRPAGGAALPHWFSVDGSSVSLDALSAATRLSRDDLAAMAPPRCRPRWPEELGACAACLAAAAEAARPITWSRTWMNPLGVVCSIHGTWLVPVATRKLAGVRHAGDFGGLAEQLAAAPRPDDLPAFASDALWFQELCTARTFTHPPWGSARPEDFVRIVDAVAREVMAATDSVESPSSMPTDLRQEFVKSFVVEIGSGERVAVSLPTRLRHRQWLLARVSHVLRWSPAERTCFSSWPTASVKRFVSVRDWPDETLAWICPPAAELVRKQEALQREFSTSPRYFRACAALFSSLE